MTEICLEPFECVVRFGDRNTEVLLICGFCTFSQEDVQSVGMNLFVYFGMSYPFRSAISSLSGCLCPLLLSLNSFVFASVCDHQTSLSTIYSLSVRNFLSHALM